MKREQLIETVKNVLQNETKVDFCEVAGISRPTLDKFLYGGDVIPAVELAISNAAELMGKKQPAPAA